MAAILANRELNARIIIGGGYYYTNPNSAWQRYGRWILLGVLVALALVIAFGSFYMRRARARKLAASNNQYPANGTTQYQNQQYGNQQYGNQQYGNQQYPQYGNAYNNDQTHQNGQAGGYDTSYPPPPGPPPASYGEGEKFQPPPGPPPSAYQRE